MTAKERIRTILEGGIPDDRIAMNDSLWSSTVERWHREGLPADTSPQEHFGVNDFCKISADYSLMLPVKTLEEAEDYRIYTDHNGVTCKDYRLDRGWVTYRMDWSIKNEEDWKQFEPHMAFRPDRLPSNALEMYERGTANGQFITFMSHASFHPVWELIGQENELIWMSERPDLVREIALRIADLVIENYEEMKKIGIVFDGAFIADDMGYRSGTMFSRKMYLEIIFPAHKRICDHLNADGTPPILHSDGDVRDFIPDIIKAGFKGLHPLEVKAGLDVLDLKERYGDQLVLYGNIDARALAGTREDIEREISSKIPLAKEGGGYIYHSDHSVPDDVPLENYAYTIELVREYGSY
ncbi:MAG: uroporphyrinogen decarboxylase family protein [Planctomycetota bacterium]|jgi:uroporphyrinogen decarboxylase|nr:uroporphyrinogen decarboxylase family protein [Planctomycetota bacterium]